MSCSSPARPAASAPRSPARPTRAARGSLWSAGGLEPLQQLAAQLGEGAAAFQADVRDLDALQRAADATVARFGGIDVVIANAGIAPPSEPILTIDPGEFERTVDIDLLGQWRTVRATLPAVIERRGHISSLRRSTRSSTARSTRPTRPARQASTSSPGR